MVQSLAETSETPSKISRNKNSTSMAPTNHIQGQVSHGRPRNTLIHQWPCTSFSQRLHSSSFSHILHSHHLPGFHFLAVAFSLLFVSLFSDHRAESCPETVDLTWDSPHHLEILLAFPKGSSALMFGPWPSVGGRLPFPFSFFAAACHALARTTHSETLSWKQSLRSSSGVVKMG